MKRIFAFILGVAALIEMTSCSTKINLAAPYKNVTVVYGLLDMADTAHYIRIEKVFSSQTLSALNIAQVADSSYFDSLYVVVKAVNSGGNIDQVFPLTLVDLTTEGYPKDSGIFFTSPNYAYKFKTPLDPGHTYRLVISNHATGEIDSAVSPVIDDIDHTVFSIFHLDNISDPIDGIAFASTKAGAVTNVGGSYLPVSNQPSPAIYQCTFRLRWVDEGNGTQTQRSADFNFGNAFPSSNSYGFSTPNSSIYQFILLSMGQAPAGVSRYLDSCDVFVYAGSQDLATYQKISQVQGTGLTANEIEPNYTNIKGANVLGLYTGRGLRTDRVRISATTVDSLVLSSNSGYLQGTHIVGTIY